MAKYLKHARQKNKYKCSVCDYGESVGKSRQAVTNHYNKSHKEGDSEHSSSSFTESLGEIKNPTSIEEEPKIKIEDNDDSKPDWLNFETEI